MYDWQEELNNEAKKDKKRWNGKVIVTGKQWIHNADGAIAPIESSFGKIWDAVNDYRNTRDWG